MTKRGPETRRTATVERTIGKSSSGSSVDPLPDPWTGTLEPLGQGTLDLDLPNPTPAPNQPGIPHPYGHGILDRWIEDEVNTNKLRTPSPRRQAAEHHICPHCFDIVISGVYDLANAPGRSLGTFTVDPTPLTEQQAHACTLTSRTTYRARLNPFGSIEIIDARLLPCEQTHPPPDGELLLPAHQCGARFPGFHTPPHDPDTERAHDDPDTIPF